MIERPLRPTLEHMLQAIHDVRSFTQAISYHQFSLDARTRLAVERCIEIIAEAARRLPAEICERYADVPWEDVRGIGNILRHGYDVVDDRIIWTVVERHLGPLEDALKRIAKDHRIDLGQRSGGEMA